MDDEPITNEQLCEAGRAAYPGVEAFSVCEWSPECGRSKVALSGSNDRENPNGRTWKVLLTALTREYLLRALIGLRRGENSGGPVAAAER